MADTKVSALTNNTDPQDTDELYLVDDPAGTAASNALTLGQAHRYTINTANVAAFSATGYSLTGTSAVSAIDIAGTWNTTGTPTGIKFNVTDTASNASSLLMDLQVGGASKFTVRKDGVFGFNFAKYAPYSIASYFGVASNNANHLAINSGASGYGIAVYGVGGHFNINTVSGMGLGFSSGTGGAYTTPDLLLTRAAAASLRLGATDAASPVAQTLGVQSVVAGTTDTAGVDFTIKGSAGTGSGAGGSIVFQVAPAGTSGTSQNAFATALTIAPDTTFGSNARLTFSGGSSPFISTDEDGSFIFRNNSSLWGAALGQKGGGLYGLALGASMLFGWGSLPQTDGDTAMDVILARDAANTLALRNGTNAQAFNIYNTTDGTNKEYLSAYWSGNDAIISTLKDGTGNALPLFVRGQTLFFGGAIGANHWKISTSGHFLAQTDNAYDIGASGANRPRSIYAGTSVTPSAAVAVSALPTPVLGMMAQVNDATTPAVGLTVTGGGAAAALVWYNGSNWTVIGV